MGSGAPRFFVEACPAEGHLKGMADGPDMSFEKAAWDAGFIRVAGVDEVGRGPLAGPVVAAAVVLDPARIPEGLNDSKKVPARRRASLADKILESAEVGVGRAEVEEIDAINILRASHVAMVRAIEALPTPPDYVLVDGNMIPRDLLIPAEAIVKGDGRSQSIAAASIVAKIGRDTEMASLAQQYPGYGWERNAGYPTAEHRARLKSHGVTPFHRRSFKPVHDILWQEKILGD